MIVYKCRFTGDEMLTDAFEPKPVKDEKGEDVPGLFQIQSQRVNKDSGASIDIGCGDAFGGGGAGVDDTAEYVNNVTDESYGFDMHEIPMSKKDLREFLQTYCRKLRQKLRDDENVPGPQVKAFTEAAPIFCKWILSKYNDLLFYTGSSMNAEGSLAFAYYEDVDPIFVYIKAGMIEEKC